MKDLNSSVVKLGWRIQVEIYYETGPERLEFIIVPDAQADFAAGFLGEGTALSKAILGERVGGVIPFFAGEARSVTILSVSPVEELPTEDLAARRQERYRQAVEESDRTNAMIFASSFSGKWGDYDPQGIEEWEKK
jgi:hypothetical protein